MPCKEGVFMLYCPVPNRKARTPDARSSNELEALMETMRRSLKLKGSGSCKEHPKGYQPYYLPYCCSRVNHGDLPHRKVKCCSNTYRRVPSGSPRVEVEADPQRALLELLRHCSLIQEAVKRLRARRGRECCGRCDESQGESCCPEVNWRSRNIYISVKE